MTARSPDGGCHMVPTRDSERCWRQGSAEKCSDLGYILTVDSRVDWVWAMRDEEISDVPWGFVLGIRVGGG